MKTIYLTIQEFFNFKKLVKPGTYEASVKKQTVCIHCNEEILRNLGYL